MASVKLIPILFLSSIVLVFMVNYSFSCNEIVCASIVSKCMLTQSCKCDLKNCTCCKECFTCLSYLYSECCSCVELCPKPNDTNNALSKQSHVEEFQSAIPELFKALTVDSEEQGWSVVTFPVDYDAALYGAKNKQFEIHSPDQTLDPNIKERVNILTINCTVAYMAQCMSWNKCRQTCLSMGSASYRWFHDGCCECVGSTCINYGINESRCSECHEAREDMPELPPNDDELDYGEGMGPLDNPSMDTYI